MRLAFGLLLLVAGVFGFLALCSFAAWKMPEWSNGDQRHFVQSFRFLVFRFRHLAVAHRTVQLEYDVFFPV